MDREKSPSGTLPGVVDTTCSPRARLRPVPIGAVGMKDGFWRGRMEANRTRAIPRLLELLEEHGVVDNLRRMTGRKQCPRRGPLFTDSDLYKWMEAAAFALHGEPDPSLEKQLDGVIDEVLAAQGDDGYLNSWYVDERVHRRFTNLRQDHELYCAGHLFQAAIAHQRATGSRLLLDAAIRFADYLCDTFGPDKAVQGHGGHPEIEMALIELYRTTGSRRYVDLVKYFFDDMKLVDQPGLYGHAVRQVYALAGAVDYCMEAGDDAIWSRCLSHFDDLVTGKMYVTGGVGSRYVHEAFGERFELPNLRSYTETCAAIGNLFWNWRMLLATGDARYTDLVERVLYNGFLSGVSLSGTEYFYVNPLASVSGARRQPWYDCTCCPPNVQRLIASLPGYLFGRDESGLYVHLYDACMLDTRLADGTAVQLSIDARYPWSGKMSIEVKPSSPSTFALYLRIPGWCRGARVSVNGHPVESPVKPGSYCAVSREWKPGDVVELDLPMTVVAMSADARVPENRGCVALMRGPIVYCLEQPDNTGVALDRVRLPIDASTRLPDFEAVHEAGLLNGVTVLRGRGEEVTGWSELYRPLEQVGAESVRPVDLTAIPCYAWANRDPGAMTVWIPYRLS